MLIFEGFGERIGGFPGEDRRRRSFLARSALGCLEADCAQREPRLASGNPSKKLQCEFKNLIRGRRSGLEELPTPVGRRQPPLSRVPRVSTVTLGIRFEEGEEVSNWP